jgi:hypothetical protein
MNLLPYLWEQSQEQRIFRASVLSVLKTLTGVFPSFLTYDRRWVNQVLHIILSLSNSLHLEQTLINLFIPCASN